MAAPELDCMFRPSSVAIAGVSGRESVPPGGGQRFLKAVLDFGFKGDVYAVNPKGGELGGLTMYRSIREIPGPLDYVISCVPASATPALMQDCVDRGVKVFHCFSSGFAESGTEEGRRLQETLLSLARGGGVRMLGPNCLGVYCPAAGLSFLGGLARESGHVSLLSQSGGNATFLVREAARRGVRFSKVVSYGNAADVDESDLLEYFAADADTDVVLAYVEGVKDGRRFGRVLRDVARAKPVAVLKAGASETGAEAAASHTGALSGADAVWAALLHQAGAIRVAGLEELVDMALAFSSLPPELGNRVGVIGIGGGMAVLAGDECSTAGLTLPRFDTALRRRMARLLGTEAGTILTNPVDLAYEVWGSGVRAIVEALKELDAVDFTMVHFPVGLSVISTAEFSGMWDRLVEDLVTARKETGSTLIAVAHVPSSATDYEWMLRMQESCAGVGIPVFHSVGSAARAVDRLRRYRERRVELSDA